MTFPAAGTWLRTGFFKFLIINLIFTIMSVNKVILLGYVGKDPEVKEFESGKVAKMTIRNN